MEYFVGIVLAALLCAFAAVAGFDRDRVFYPTMVLAIATYYILFAAIGKSTQALIMESVGTAGFFVLAAVGFKKNLWVAVAALAGHGVFDCFHPMLIQNPGVPLWWPGFCASFDVLAGTLLALILVKRSGFALPVSR